MDRTVHLKKLKRISIKRLNYRQHHRNAIQEDTRLNRVKVEGVRGT
jgi:hypothetical protein